MSKYLAIYDLSGIQSFIFQTNKLKEIIGASQLVSRALFDNAPDLLNEDADDWRGCTAEQLRELAPGKGKVVYIGGGNALVLFGSRETELQFTYLLKKTVFEQTGGSIRLCSGGVELDDDQKKLAEYQSDYIKDLDTDKRKSSQALTIRGFSLNEQDNNTYEPVLYFPEANTLNDPDLVNSDADYALIPDIATRSQFLKLREYQRSWKIANGKAAQDDNLPSHLSKLFPGRMFKTEFEKFFDRSSSASPTPGKRYLAVVHIDGNTMGMRIANFVKGLRADDSQSNKDVFDDLMSLRDLSAHITQIYTSALQRMMDDVYGESTNSALEFRPIIADGDDITFVCRSEKAFPCFEAFVKALTETGQGIEYQEGLPRPEEFSVGAGVAFIPFNYPFSSAYDIAEELCGNAKRKALERREGLLALHSDQSENAKPETTINSIDFHVCSGELTDDIDAYRKRFYVFDEYYLNKRPYHVLSSGSENLNSLEFEDFINRLQDLTKAVENGWLARGKIKDLYNEYSKGKTAAVRYGEYIESRELAIAKARQSNTNASRESFFQDLKDVFEVSSIGKDGSQTVAKHFDVLDVFDICKLPVEDSHD